MDLQNMMNDLPPETQERLRKILADVQAGQPAPRFESEYSAEETRAAEVAAEAFLPDVEPVKQFRATLDFQGDETEWEYLQEAVEQAGGFLSSIVERDEEDFV
jgi:hypothetical protein